jgi:hypothetical protein
MGNKIERNRTVHLDTTLEALGIYSDEESEVAEIPETSELELVGGDENDEQTTSLFSKFITLGTNFATPKSTERCRKKSILITYLNGQFAELEEEMQKDINQFDDMADHFADLIHIYVMLVIKNKSDMCMAGCRLKHFKSYMSVLCEVISPANEAPLVPNNIDFAFEMMASDINALLDLASRLN